MQHTHQTKRSSISEPFEEIAAIKGALSCAGCRLFLRQLFGQPLASVYVQRIGKREMCKTRNRHIEFA